MKRVDTHIGFGAGKTRVEPPRAKALIIRGGYGCETSLDIEPITVTALFIKAKVITIAVSEFLKWGLSKLGRKPITAKEFWELYGTDLASGNFQYVDNRVKFYV